jgi:hypothetical protein
MKIYSSAELEGILNVVNDPQFNSVRLRITTGRPVPIVEEILATPPADDRVKGSMECRTGEIY